ncbi:MAG TPA: hypothetical protein VKA53_01915 [Thermoanaerobaculia bacterium]|nr:hypothetical protein [Thermoanaerobaculia bacterium]
MKRTLSSTLFVLALVLAPGLAQPAAAQVYGGFSVGGWFRVGPVSLSLAFGAPDEGAAPGYYYRMPVRYGYLVPACRDAFRLGAYLYYPPSCSAMESFLGYYNQRPDILFQAYAPPPVWRGLFYGSYGSGYGAYGRYGSYGRYGNDGRYDVRRDRDWRSDRRRGWTRSERRNYYRRYGLSRRDFHRERGDRDRGRDRGRHHGHDWREHR